MNDELRHLRSEIMLIESRYDGIFPPGVWAVLKKMKEKETRLVQEKKEKQQ